MSPPAKRIRGESLGELKLYRIGQLAEKGNVSRRTIDFYTREGLLKPDERTEGNFRLYSETCLHRLAIIKTLQSHHWSLDEIKHYLTAFDSESGRSCMETLQAVNNRLKEIEKDLLHLQTYPDQDFGCDCKKVCRDISVRVRNVMNILQLNLQAR